MKEYITLLDIDGPCAPFDKEIIKIVAPHITDDDIRKLNDWDVFKLFTKDELDFCHEILKDDSFWRNLPVFEDAQKEVEKMRSNGERVVFLTSRWDGCQSWCGARFDWLKKNFNAVREDIFIGTSKELVYGDRLIDDKLANVLSWQKRWKKGEGLLFQTLSNYKSSYYPRIIQTPDGWKKEIFWLGR